MGNKGNDNGGNDNGSKGGDGKGRAKPDPDVLSAALAQGLEHEAQQEEETRNALQEQLNQGVRQLRALAHKHGLVWPEDD